MKKGKVGRVIGIGREFTENRRDGRTDRQGVESDLENLVQFLDRRWSES